MSGKIEIVIKGGQPWGFRLLAKPENRTSVIVHEIVCGGRADQQGGLKAGDRVIKINDVRCLSLADALQLIDSAFRTLTILIWRPSKSVGDCIYWKSNNALERSDLKSNHSSLPLHNNSSSIYENIQNFTYQEESVSCKENASSQENVYCNRFNSLVNSDRLCVNRSKIQSKKIPNYFAQTLMSSYKYPAIKDTTEFLNESMNAHNCEEKSHLVPFKKLYQNDIQCLNKKPSFSHPPIFSENDLKVNCVISCCQQTVMPASKIQESLIVSKDAFSNEFAHCSSKKKTIDTTPSVESCMYPNCHSDYINCKIHSPPERDIAYPIYQSFEQIKNDSNTWYTHSVSSKDQIKQDFELVDSFSNNFPIEEVDSESWKKGKELLVCGNSKLQQEENSKPLNLYDQIKTLSSNTHAEYQFRKALPSNSTEPIYSTHPMPFDNQHISTQNNISSYFDDKVKSRIEVKKESPLQSTLTVGVFNKDTVFKQLNHNSFDGQIKGILNRTLFLCSKPSSSSPTTSTVNKKASFLTEQDLLDEELSEIEKNKSSLHAAGHLSVSETPPLPSPPPPDTETEILATDEPLPPPPSFLFPDDASWITENTCQLTETIYANLEILKIQCSVVNSATQTGFLHKEKQSIEYSTIKSAEITRNCSSYTEKTSPQLEFENNHIGKYMPSKCHKSDASLVKKMIHGQEERLSKNSASLPLTSAYFTTSTPKAKLLTRYTSKLHLKSDIVEKELSSEKEELTSSITRKLSILLEEQAALQGELQQNDELGNCLIRKLEKLAKINEMEKFKRHVEELEKITNLMLSLSGRLARTENALLIFPANAATEERSLLEAKYCKLNQQYEEAMHLQGTINKRNEQVVLLLDKYLTEDELTDYEHFIKMKVKLLVDYKELIEKIKLGEEQLNALKSSIKTIDTNCVNKVNKIL